MPSAWRVDLPARDDPRLPGAIGAEEPKALLAAQHEGGGWEADFRVRITAPAPDRHRGDAAEIVADVRDRDQAFGVIDGWRPQDRRVHKARLAWLHREAPLRIGL